MFIDVSFPGTQVYRRIIKPRSDSADTVEMASSVERLGLNTEKSSQKCWLFADIE
jgi:hypothetical protein